MKIVYQLGYVNMSSINEATLKQHIAEAQAVLRNMSDGEITSSAYDTAWVARIAAADEQPMYPQCIDWICAHQHDNGAWGSDEAKYYHDQLVSTLSAIIALKTWHVADDQVAHGEAFIRDNIDKISEEAYATVGFEIIFTAMLQSAKDLDLDLPYEHPILVKILDIRERKLNKIPLEYVYNVPTTLLHSLEGLDGILDAHRVLAQQADNGSFLNSPSATAYIYMQTGDEACLQYVDEVVETFGDHVPVTYPLDLFERLWVLNSLYELGIEHYFADEIAYHLDYVAENFTKRGVPWSRYVQVPDIDNTSVAFKLLRLNHRYIDASVFEHFYDPENRRFFCFPGELDASLSHMLNFYQAAQLNAHEEVLDRAELFGQTFLQSKFKSDSFADKWLVWDHLGDFVEYLLNQHRFDTAPSIEKRFGRELVARKVDAIHWLDKVVYYLPNVNAQVFLDVALAEQALQEEAFADEYAALKAWANENVSVWSQRTKPLLFTAFNLFPKIEQRFARLTLCKISLWIFAIDDVIDNHRWEAAAYDQLAQFILQPQAGVDGLDADLVGRVENLAQVLYEIIDELVACQGEAIRPVLTAYLVELLHAYGHENTMKLEGTLPDMDEYLSFASITVAVRLTMGFAVYALNDVDSAQFETDAFWDLLGLASDVTRALNDIRSFERERDEGKLNAVDSVMAHLNLDYDQATHWLRVFANSKMRDILQFNMDDEVLSPDIKTLMFNVCRVTAWIYKASDFHDQKIDMRL